MPNKYIDIVNDLEQEIHDIGWDIHVILNKAKARCDSGYDEIPALEKKREHLRQRLKEAMKNERKNNTVDRR